MSRSFNICRPKAELGAKIVPSKMGITGERNRRIRNYQGVDMQQTQLTTIRPKYGTPYTAMCMADYVQQTRGVSQNTTLNINRDGVQLSESIFFRI